MRRGWFAIPGVQAGDRTVEQQLKGLGPLFDEVSGKTVLDLGCAEGMIARELITRGASFVQGMEGNRAFVDRAEQVLDGVRGGVLHCDLNGIWAMPSHADGDRWDVVLMLAVLHKLREPGTTLRYVAQHQPGLIVVRLPPETAPVIVDSRSGNRPYNVQADLETHGYALEQVTRGHFDEWCGYFRRAA